jgi:Zn-dependent protease with chaperone function
MGEASPQTQGSLPRVVPNARPLRFRRTWDWLEQGAERQSNAALAAVVAAWTGLPIALWLAALGVVAGTLAGIFGASQIGLAHTLHVDEGVGVLGAAFGAIVGALGGFLLIVVGYIHEPAAFLGAIVSGLVIAVLTLAILVVFEARFLPLRGYRPLSRREQERLYPLLQETGRRMGMTVVPALWASDSHKPSAWTHMRAIVVTRGLLGDYDASEAGPMPELDDAALSAVLAHELHHWQVGDALGLSMVWACFWPVVIFFNAAMALRERAGLLGILAWIFLWPTWVTTKLVVMVMATQSRRCEYEADARVASLGDDYRLGLRRALDNLREWEKPRTGWEDAVAATHPPIELRLERLESPRDPQPAPGAVPPPPPAMPGPAPVVAPPAPTPAPVVEEPVRVQTESTEPPPDPPPPDPAPPDRPSVEAESPEPPPPSPSGRNLARTRDAEGGPYVPDLPPPPDEDAAEPAAEEATSEPPGQEDPDAASTEGEKKPEPPPKAEPETRSDAADQWGIPAEKSPAEDDEGD